MHTWIRAVAFVAVLTGVVFGQLNGPLPPVHISGRILDASGAPIPNAHVHLTVVRSQREIVATRTDQNGAFSCRVASPIMYELSVDAQHFKPLVMRVKVDVGRDLEIGDLVMKLPGGDEVDVSSIDDEPIRTTVCQLMKMPVQFNGKIVQIRAEYVSTFQWAGFVDESCSAKLQVGVFHVLDNLKPEQGEYAFTRADDANTHPERLNWKPIQPPRPVQLNQDANYRTFQKYTDTKFRWPDGETCHDCPLYQINVTATGRFDYFETQTVAVRANPATKAFGHSSGDDFNAPLSRLVLQSVADVLATPIDPAVYTERKGREITLEEAHDLVTALMKDRGNTTAPGFSLEQYSDPHFPEFLGFQAVFDNPNPGSFNLGFYAVDRKTGDVWNGIICERMKSASLKKLQRTIRLRIGLTESEYRKARRPGPMCE